MASNCVAIKLMGAALVLLSQFTTSCGQDFFGVCQLDGADTACFPTPEALTKSAVFNLTLTPESATCGTPPSQFCSEYWPFGCLTYETCNSADPLKRHPKEFLVDDSTNTWWLSTNRSDHNELPVTIQISFDKKYELSGRITLLFNSDRPREMIIEKSLDHGRTWAPLQYYSTDCNKYSGVTSGSTVTTANPTAVICTAEFSAPGIQNTVVFVDRHLMFTGPLSTDYPRLYEALENNPAFQDFLSFTDLRFRLILPGIIGSAAATPLGDYYAISNIDVSGRCSCNLHAVSCSLVNGFTKCNCEHNTEGTDCERCQPLYNDRPWMKGSYIPFPTGTANACTKCECNGHALSCFYDSTYGRGVCEGCIDNTLGNHCELCASGFYHNSSVPLSDPNTCILCDCEPLGIVQGSVDCSQVAVGGLPIGQCPCKPQVAGRRCDTCQDGYYGLFQGDQPGTCKSCFCNTLGTVGGSNTCNKQTGQCPCKPSTDGRDCGQCKPGYHTFPLAVLQECISCGCDWGGGSSDVCEASTGDCSCKTNVQGAKCTQATSGSYFPYLDVNVLDPASGTCTKDNALQTEVLHDGEFFARCQPNQQVIFQQPSVQMKQPQIQWPYQFGVRYTHNAPFSWTSVTLMVTVTGNSGITDISEYAGKQTEPINGLICLQIGVSKQWTVSFPSGVNTAWLTPPGDEMMVDARCKYQFMLIVGAKDPNDPANDIIIDSVVLLPALAPYQAYVDADNATKLQYDDCLRQSAALGTKHLYTQGPQCRTLSFSAGTQINSGAQACDCDPKGTLTGSLCDEFGGQCTCKTGVSGRQCDTCQPGYYNFTDNGCTACPVSGCPTTPAPVTTSPTVAPTTEPNTTTSAATTTAPPSNDSSMLFVYLAIGIFLAVLLILCIILAVILCRRCAAVRSLKAEEDAYENSIHARHGYKEFAHDSDESDEGEPREGGNTDGDKLEEMSVNSLNLEVKSTNDDVETGLKSSNMADRKSSTRSINSMETQKQASSSPSFQQYTSPSDKANQLTHKSDKLQNDERNAFPLGPMVRGAHVRQPPDGMSTGINDESKQPISQDNQQKISSNPSAATSTRVPAIVSKAGNTPDRSSPENVGSGKTDTYARATPAPPDRNSAGTNIPRSQNVQANGLLQNPPFTNLKGTPEKQPVKNQNHSNLRPDSMANTQPTAENIPPNPSALKSSPSTGLPLSAHPPLNSPETNSLRNSLAPSGSNFRKQVSPNQKDQLNTPPKNPVKNPQMSNASTSGTQQRNVPNTTRPQTSSQSRRNFPLRNLDDVDPKQILIHKNPNLNYAGFGEFDEINGSLV